MSNIDKHELLRNLAYQSWLDRGQPYGSPEIDWSRAQQQLEQQAVSIAASISGELETDSNAPPATAQSDTEAANSIPTISDAIAAPTSQRSARRVKASEVPLEVPPSPTTPPDQPPTKAKSGRSTSKTVASKPRAARNTNNNADNDDARL